MTAVVPALREWVLKRGILFGLTQTPMIALFIGYFYRWTTVPIATAFTVLLAFVILPPWVLVRRRLSDDPDEPVHHLHRYALWALLPYVVYNLARIPAHAVFGIVFWDHWYDFGSELTGEPVDQWSSLIPGTLLHSLQGYVLALGFYILFKQHSLLSSLAYVFIFLSVVYTWTFPGFVLVDFQPPPVWFFVVWWAHFWMALAVYFTPRLIYSPRLWQRTRGGRTSIVAVLILIYILPVGFVFTRVATWQFEAQRQIDEDTFNQVELVLQDGPTLASVGPSDVGDGEEAVYEFTLRFGPRPYEDYIKATKAVDAGPVEVSARVLRAGQVVAVCFAYVEELETPNNILVPTDYFPALERMEFTDIPVSCSGPADGATGDGAIEVAWTAQVTLVGDRETEQRTYQSTATG